MKLAYRLAVIALILAMSASGAALIGNLPGVGDGLDLNLYSYYTGATFAAAGFRSGPAQFLLEEVTLRLYAYDLFNMGNTPLAPLVSLYSGTDTTITTLVAALTGPANLMNDHLVAQTPTFTPTVAITLSPNTYYWLVLQGQSASTTKTAWAGTTNAAGSPSSTVGFFSLGYRGNGSTLGNMQTQSDKYFYYQISGSQVTGGGGGNPPPDPPTQTPEAATLVMIASGFLLMRVRRWKWAQPA